jgi:hypothetical protein
MLTRSKTRWQLAALALLVFVPTASNLADAGACRAPPPPDDFGDQYPAHQLSPSESLKSFDSVFYGEVVVPARPCSIGFCAGLKVLAKIKGDVPRTVLVQAMRPGDNPCGPANFNNKGVRWVVFANRGSTRGGLTYIAADDTGPSYASPLAPDFNRLEMQYRQLRARLDEAIDERLGRGTRLR